MGQTAQFRIQKMPSVTLNELAMKARERISSFNKAANKKRVLNPNGVQITTCLEYIRLNIQNYLMSQNISAYLNGRKEKDKLHFG